MRAGALHGQAQIPDDPSVERFLVTCALRREFGMTQREISRLTRKAVRWHLAYLEGLSDAAQEKSKT